jgi:hypothetical protein
LTSSPGPSITINRCLDGEQELGSALDLVDHEGAVRGLLHKRPGVFASRSEGLTVVQSEQLGVGLVTHEQLRERALPDLARALDHQHWKGTCGLSGDGRQTAMDQLSHVAIVRLSEVRPHIRWQVPAVSLPPCRSFAVLNPQVR